MDKYSTFKEFDYILKRKPRQRSIRMHIDPKGKLSVSCGFFVPQSEIEKFLLNNLDWIKNHSVLLEPYHYVSGELIPFWGKDYSLDVQKGHKQCFINQNKISVYVSDVKNINSIRKTLCEFYKISLLNYLPNRLEYWCKNVGVEVPIFSVNNAKSRWGVCYYKKKEIKISAMTACLPEELIDMTILHEVCHLKYPNHSKDFWALVKSNIPDLDKKKQMLKQVDRTRAIHSLF